MKKPVIIGIAGGTASGKSTVAKRLSDAFMDNASVVIIRQDDYYKDQSEKTMEERIRNNYDHPLAFDNDLLVKQLDDLSNHVPIEKPTYDFVQHTRSDVTEFINPSDVIILEGLFVLESDFIRKRLDIKIFVDTEADVRFIRRLKRDIKERGRTLEQVIEQYTETVKPMHDQFIEPSKKYADIIIPEGGRNEVAIDLLITKIHSIIEDKS